jgi:hypothetical protein
MANNLTNYAENKVLNHILGVAAFTMPTVYLALFTADPTEAGTGTEVSGGAYARKAIAFTTATTGATSNSADVLFDTATASWGTITHVGLMDALTGGNMLWYGALSTAKTVPSGDQFKMAATKLSVSIE